MRRIVPDGCHRPGSPGNRRRHAAPPVIRTILTHIGEPPAVPHILLARGPPQAEFEFDQTAGTDGWSEIDQTAGRDDDGWD